MKPLARILRRLGAWFYRVASRIDPPARVEPLPLPAPAADELGLEMRAAHEIILRHHLHRACRPFRTIDFPVDRFLA